MRRGDAGEVVRGVGIALALALLSTTVPVRAQGHASFEELIGQAISEFQLGHWVEARSLFEQAHAAAPSARTLRGLGMVEFELRHYVQSVRYLSQALTDPRSPLSPELRARTQELLDRAHGFVARYRIERSPPEAELRLDGNAVELEADGSLLLVAGDHTLTASAPGHRTHQQRLDVTGGDARTLRVALIPLESPAASPTPAQTAEASPATTAPGPAAASAPAQPSDVDDGGVLSRWWFWTLAAAVVAGGVVTVALVTATEEPRDPTPGDDDVVIMALELP